MRPEMLAASIGQTIRGAVSPLALRVAALEAAGDAWPGTVGALEASLADVRAALDELRARPLIPGPPGPPGPAGPAGAAGLRYLGVHVAGKTYDCGDIVTAGGSAWHCQATTTAAPGHAPEWQLMVKRGKDGKDGAR